MKKIVLLSVVFSCFNMMLIAQTKHIDTIDLMDWHPDNYFLNWWPADTNVKAGYFSRSGMGVLNNVYDTLDIATVNYHTNDTLYIDGLAISMGLIFDPRTAPPGAFSNIVSDTTFDSCYTYAMLYQAHGNSMQLLDSAYVHITNTPIAYYIKIGGNAFVSTPIYEVPINEVAVIDTFFVGVTSDFTYNVAQTPNRHWPLMFMMITAYNLPQRILRLHYEMRPVWEERIIYDIPMMFPILSEHQPGDSNRTAIETCERLDAVTTVSPSLASEVVTVQCGFNMSNVEVYDMQGRLIASKRQAGHLTQFNVGAWPEGVYVMRISTMAGITTQRVVVTR